MKTTVAAEVARLERMSVSRLAARFEEVFGEQCRSRHKRYLIRRIAWRLQANAEGGLSERARQRAEELASDAEIRVTPPRKNVRSGELRVRPRSGSGRPATSVCRGQATGSNGNTKEKRSACWCSRTGSNTRASVIDHCPPSPRRSPAPT